MTLLSGEGKGLHGAPRRRDGPGLPSPSVGACHLPRSTLATWLWAPNTALALPQRQSGSAAPTRSRVPGPWALRHACPEAGAELRPPATAAPFSARVLNGGLGVGRMGSDLRHRSQMEKALGRVELEVDAPSAGWVTQTEGWEGRG